MKVERCGLDRVEHWIEPTLPSVITIPVVKGGKEFVIYLSVLPLKKGSYITTDRELQAVAKEIANKLEIEPAE